MDQSSISTPGINDFFGGIDVVIPVYNGAPYIAQTLHSVLTQTLPPRKVIIVDDGSTDASVAVVTAIAVNSNVPITIIRQKNRGLSAARNTGIKACTASYIAFVDADDIWAPEKLALQHAVFDISDMKLGAVYCSYDLVDENTAPLIAPVMQIDPRIRGDIFGLLLAGNNITGSASGIVVRRSVFDIVGYFDESLTSYEDWDMWLRIAREYSFDYRTETLVHIRRHRSNMQKSYLKMLENEIRFYNKWTAELGKKTPPSWKDNMALSVMVTGVHIMEALTLVQGSLSPSAAQAIFGPYRSIALYLPVYLAKRLFHKVSKVSSI